MGRYRTRLQIVADILTVVSSDDAKKTRIMYLANLSWDLLTRYLNDLLEADLIRFGSSECYVLTLKGKLFLERFVEHRKRRRSVEKQLNDVDNEKTVLEKMFLKAEAVDESGS